MHKCLPSCKINCYTFVFESFVLVGHITFLEPKNPTIGEFNVAQKRRTTDYGALNCEKFGRAESKQGLRRFPTDPSTNLEPQKFVDRRILCSARLSMDGR